jgi:hypothetical protein
MFVAFTYLYRTGYDLPSLVIVTLTWAFVLVLRLREKQIGPPNSIWTHPDSTF